MVRSKSIGIRLQLTCLTVWIVAACHAESAAVVYAAGGDLQFAVSLLRREARRQSRSVSTSSFFCSGAETISIAVKFLNRPARSGSARPG